MNCSLIAIIGGTFNPIHCGHIKAAENVLFHYGPDKVLFIPTGIPPHKDIGDNMPSGDDRLEMVRIAIKDEKKFEASAIEINRAGKSFTADTIDLLKHENPNLKILLIVGTDMLCSFETWYRFKDILKVCKLVGVCRNESDRNIMNKEALRLSHKYGADIEIPDFGCVDISSTDIRRILSLNSDASDLLPAGVLSYIRKNNLYK